MLGDGKEIGLCVVQVGTCAASSIYVSRKEARAQKLGFVSTTMRLPEDASEESFPSHS